MIHQEDQLLQSRIAELEKELALASRELEIEAALESVRSRAMAMQKSEEMQEIVDALFDQLKEVGVDLDTANILLFREGTKDVDCWTANAYYSYATRFSIPYAAVTVLKDIHAANEKHEGLLSKSYTVAEKNELFDYLLHYSGFKHLPSARKQQLLESRHCALSVAMVKQVGVLMISYTKPSFTEEENEVLQRFTRVFSQAYTRFLDLEKAEAQAREARIEAALETVRASSMAMHRSEELDKVVNTLAGKLVELGLSLDGAFLFFFEKEKKSFYLWVATNHIPAPLKVSMPYEPDLQTNPIVSDLWKAFETGTDFLNKAYTGSIKNDYFRFIAKHNGSTIPEAIKKLHQEAESWTASFTGGKHSVVGVDSWHGKTITPDEFQVLKRFANVFEQAYTRFLDLQKAEAQAREAQIEAALERLRSKAMAMQTSAELYGVVHTMYSELKKLDESLNRCFVMLFDAPTRDVTWWMAGDGVDPTDHAYLVPYSEHPPQQAYLKGWEEQQEKWQYLMEGAEKKAWDDYLFSATELTQLPPMVIQFMRSAEKIYLSASFTHFGCLTTGSFEPLGQTSFDILIRFTRIFDLTYTRFNDLKQAEAQAREAQIEAALERVRSRTIGMQRSDELQAAAVLLFQQVVALGVPAFGCGFNIWDEDQKFATAWMGGEDRIQPPFKTSSSEDIFLRIYEAAQRGEPLFVEEQEGDALKNHYAYMNSIPLFKEIADKMAQAGQSLPTFQIMHCAFFPQGYLMFISYEPVPYAYDIFIRFTKVFEQTYTRFLDLQKAEAQAREAQIEAALERVRARTMAMHRSEELSETAAILFKQLNDLGNEPERISIAIPDESTGMITFWVTNQDGGQVNVSYQGRIDEPTTLKKMYDGWKAGELSRVIDLQGEELTEWLRFCREEMHIEVNEDSGKDRRVHKIGYFSHGWLTSHGWFNTTAPETSSLKSIELLERFASVFNLTYRRFLDLQKAEAQAREAQIEAALERVRSRTMAMHTSEDVTSATETMFEELKKLGLDNLRCGIANIHQDRTFDVFGVTNLAAGNTMSGFGLFGMDEHPIWQRWFESWKNKDEVFIAHIAGQEKEEYFSNINNHSNYLPQRIVDFPDSFFQAYYFEQGAVWVYSLLQHSEAEKEIMKRFAMGFTLTFRRYQDLRKAEAQAREAQIEAALEKVRARAMAMQTSEDVSSATAVLFSELHKLGIETMRCGILIIRAPYLMELWASASGSQGHITKIIGEVKMTIHELLRGVYRSWEQKKDIYYYHLTGEDMYQYYQAIAEEIPTYARLQSPEMPDHHCYVFYFDEGGLYTFSVQPHPEETKQVLKRFTAVFSLTFRRFQDLKNAEAQAREAIKASSLDRIRAEIASMRTTDDLNRITPSVWKELTALGVPFFRCGVFIMNEKGQLVHVYLSTPDGKPLAVLHLPFQAAEFISKAVDYWRLQQVYFTHWDQEQFIAWVYLLIRQGQIQTARNYQDGDTPPASLTLQLVPFAQGMLYVGSAEALTETQVYLVKALAEAFSVAYARYEDFEKLDEAKRRVESTLEELRATQTQLIQREKMASLGELTAGIAHEIQNPLNFVNNFSELNVELLDELKAEAAQNNITAVVGLAEELKENEQKISHHGRRADAIVKSMLQHSRASTGEKEWTDINALVEEYLRLSYHGYRVKDKTFSAVVETHFDPAAGQANVVGQDIGRVLLNLFNNAFYAVAEKNKEHQNGYQPTVSVSTKKRDKGILISVKDNGTGIPEKEVDKIFQPFFTTKPTGEGTGLGLSLSYDIITKGHGGEMKVQTAEGEGTTFTIMLHQS